LNDDIGWAQSLHTRDDGSGDGSSAEEHSDFKTITQMLLLTPCTMSVQNRSIDKATSGKGSIQDITGSTAVIFDNFEDEIYFQESSLAFYFQPSSTHISLPLCAMLVPVSSLEKCVREIQKLIPGV
jgi:hypothetical protein